MSFCLSVLQEGTRGLAMFYLPIRDEHGVLNNIEIQRLKDKLGTRQVPTAELLLDGTRAIKVHRLPLRHIIKNLNRPEVESGFRLPRPVPQNFSKSIPKFLLKLTFTYLFKIQPLNIVTSCIRFGRRGA